MDNVYFIKREKEKKIKNKKKIKKEKEKDFIKFMTSVTMDILVIGSR